MCGPHLPGECGGGVTAMGACCSPPALEQCGDHKGGPEKEGGRAWSCSPAPELPEKAGLGWRGTYAPIAALMEAARLAEGHP